MPVQDDYPSVWSCESPQKGVKVEVRVPNDDIDDVEAARLGGDGDDYSWIEIPTTEVQQWVKKGDAAEVQRTAKVKLPTEWGSDSAELRHNSPRQLIESFNPTETQPFMMARVWFQHPEFDQWVLSHHGWIGGVGSASEDGVHKMWVYDFAELLSSVPVGHTFNHPRIRHVLQVLGEYTVSRTPTPLSQIRLIPPETEEELATVSGIRDNEITIGNITNFGNTLVEAAEVVIYYGSNREAIGLSPVVELDGPSDVPFDEISLDTGRDIPVLGVDSKSFVSNHDTLMDLYEWFEKKTDASLHFEPLPDSVQLVADVEPTRYTFTAESVAENANARDQIAARGLTDDDGEYEYHETVSVRKNNALYEMKPTNTVHLRGSVDRGLGDTISEAAGDVGGQLPVVGDWVSALSDPPAKKYPVVKVQVPSLVEAAGGVEMSPEVVESDATTKDTAEQEARRELRKRLEEVTEGEIIIDGHPRVGPFHRLDAFEVCGENVAYEQTPVSYEVEEARHVKKAGESFKTILRVSLWANEKNMETVEKKTVTVEA